MIVRFLISALSIMLLASSTSHIESYLKAFKAKRSLQQDIVKQLASYQSNFKKQEDMLKMVYQTMFGVLDSSLSSLHRQHFSVSSPFPDKDAPLQETLSLLYENCALFSDLYLRYPDLTESLYLKMKSKSKNFKEVAVNSIKFCHDRKDVFAAENDNGKLLNLAMQELRIVPRTEDFYNPHRKVLSQSTQKESKKKERKKIDRGPTLSKIKSEL